eukprot:3416338-Prymnesium_polylepis.2
MAGRAWQDVRGRACVVARARGPSRNERARACAAGEHDGPAALAHDDGRVMKVGATVRGRAEAARLPPLGGGRAADRETGARAAHLRKE